MFTSQKIKKGIGSLLLLFPFCSTFSQSFVTKFVEHKNIQWAAYITDTAHFSNPNLSLLLRNRLEKDEIKVFLPFLTGLNTAGTKKPAIQYITKDSLFDPGYHTPVPVYDEDGKLVESPAEKRTDLFSPLKFDSRTNDMIEFEQAIYVESGKLKTFISSVSPKYSVVTPQGTYLGFSNIFTTALNIERTIRKAKRKKAIAIGNTNAIYSLQNDSRLAILKQLYGQNLLEAIWPQLWKDGYEVISIDSARKISKEELKATLFGTAESVYVPVYDTEGNVSSRLVYGPEINAAYFSSIGITQQWFYSKSKNILFCTIPSLTLYILKPGSDEKKATETAVLKINIK